MQVGSTQDVSIPIAWEPQLYIDPERSRMYGAGVWWLRLMGRLKPGATAEQAQAQLENIFHQSVIEHRAARQALAQSQGGSPILALEAKDYPRLVVDPGGQGEMNTRQFYARPLYLLAGRSRACAVDRVRERGEPAACRARRAAEGDWRAAGDWREPLAVDAAIVDRKRAACGGGRSTRAGVRILDQERTAGCERLGRPRYARARAATRSARAGLHFRIVVADGHCVWSGSRVACD